MKTAVALPPEAFVFVDGLPGQRIQRVRQNGDGFELSDYDERAWSDDQAKARILSLNQQRGVTDDMAAWMWVAGAFGWDSPQLRALTDRPVVTIEHEFVALA